MSAGAVGTSDWDAAPAVLLDGAWSFADRTSVTGAIGGWTLGSPGGAGSELFLSLGLQRSFAITGPWSLSLAAGPAFAWRDEFGRAASFEPGLAIAPTLELATRRRTVSLRAGVLGAWLGDGARALGTVGVGYAFE